jgi:small subunit ribosomal protein S21
MTLLQVLVRDNNVDQALRVLKKRMQREGIFREMKQRKAYEKPSERKTREKAEAIRRARKAARKQAQREGLLPMPKRKIEPGRGRGPRAGGFGGGFGGGAGAGAPPSAVTPR